MAPNLTLYGDPFSANTRIVTIVLEVLELKYEFRSIDVMHGDHLSSAFQKASEEMESQIKLLTSMTDLLYSSDQPSGSRSDPGRW